jgi:hypothetical protein
VEIIGSIGEKIMKKLKVIKLSKGATARHLTKTSKTTKNHKRWKTVRSARNHVLEMFGKNVSPIKSGPIFFGGIDAHLIYAYSKEKYWEKLEQYSYSLLAEDLQKILEYVKR